MKFESDIEMYVFIGAMICLALMMVWVIHEVREIDRRIEYR